MARQYPHYLFVVKGSESIQDDDGNWSESEADKPFVSSCREETNGKGTQVQAAGGKFIVFSSLIQLPKGSEKIEAGESVFISDDPDGNNVRIKGTVLKFDQGQLHNRLWI